MKPTLFVAVCLLASPVFAGSVWPTNSAKATTISWVTDAESTRVTPSEADLEIISPTAGEAETQNNDQTQELDFSTLDFATLDFATINLMFASKPKAKTNIMAVIHHG